MPVADARSAVYAPCDAFVTNPPFNVAFDILKNDMGRTFNLIVTKTW